MPQPCRMETMMRLRFLAAFIVLAAPVEARMITDSAGRQVEVPEDITTVFAAGPTASILTYVIRPEVLAGWPRALRAEERDYIAAPYRDLPETGRLTGRGGEANLERVLQIAPDLILDFGSVRDTYIDLANRVQEQTGIPYLLIDGRFENTPEALRLVGEILNVPERGEALASDTEQIFARIDAILGDAPEEARPRTYLARGPDGLETGMKGSINTEIIERAGGVNVADDGGATRGLVQSSMETVIVANPEVVVTWDRNFYGRVWADPLWAGVEAVRTGQVYLSPTAPFGWIDRPPSVNRMMGLQWMAGLFYPDDWGSDLREETRDFFQLWYHVDLSEEELDRLLEWAEGRPPS
ncbi:iron complex transport system substrate-binding protein [Poseidonocella pacifica]|uniref:Iron complex transport system substrate-binding protein n=1 Tax=Poseidonocella pacifica TaxID=871651 RepID=A0A1I0V9V3_9RHOB|nr:ABC transporter substrate-binding protein [Poseidonocella pacifica]SFA73111.1 iron complex transport system substrate-binding protein [Poseidonocella pacifica]